MIPYEETKRGWDKAAATNPNEAIHPAGLKGTSEYEMSGSHDCLKIMTAIAGLEIDDPEIRCIEEATIIDFGAGNGRVTIPLSTWFQEIYAVDFSYAMLQQIPKSSNIRPVLSVDNWFGISEPADFAFSISVFIHNTYESGMQMMKAISENLKVGGIALLQIPVYDVATIGKSWVDVSTWTLNQLHDACNESGFEIIESFTNDGVFSFQAIGPNHHKLQVLKKIA